MRPEAPRASLLRAAPGFRAVLRIGQWLAAPACANTQLLAVGSEAYEPWHLVAHLSDAKQWAGSSLPAPLLVRHRVEPAAPAHLAHGLDRLRETDRGATVLVVAPDVLDEHLLERLADVRRRGSTVLAVGTQLPSGGQADLLDVAQDTALVVADQFEIAQHVLPAVAGSPLPPRRTGRGLLAGRWARPRAGLT